MPTEPMYMEMTEAGERNAKNRHNRRRLPGSVMQSGEESEKYPSNTHIAKQLSPLNDERHPGNTLVCVENTQRIRHRHTS